MHRGPNDDTDRFGLPEFDAGADMVETGRKPSRENVARGMTAAATARRKAVGICLGLILSVPVFRVHIGAASQPESLCRLEEDLVYKPGKTSSIVLRAHDFIGFPGSRYRVLVADDGYWCYAQGNSQEVFEGRLARDELASFLDALSAAGVFSLEAMADERRDASFVAIEARFGGKSRVVKIRGDDRFAGFLRKKVDELVAGAPGRRTVGE